MSRVLVQWIGHSDLAAMAGSLPEKKQRSLLEELGWKRRTLSDDLGPTATLLGHEAFDDVLLLSNYRAEWNNAYTEWLAHSATIRKVSLDDPTDYAKIYTIAESELAKTKTRVADWSRTELCLHLSPGTPAMASVWVLLGKTSYPATFLETTRDGRVTTRSIPFDLSKAAVTLFDRADARLQHLASQAPAEVSGFEAIAGGSRAICDAVGRAKRAAVRSISILLLGESGTGKELFAQAIHRASSRAAGPFRAINCAALSQTLLESELFGHSKGAFTGATASRPGAFESCDGGTLFLDEVGECSLETQAKLLRVLQPIDGASSSRRAVTRLGEDNMREVDVRVLAATNRDLHSEVAAGRFRDDLLYRLAAVTVRLPPLRDRRDDIPIVAEHLLRRINEQFAREEPDYAHKRLSGSAIAFVRSQHWPGNVRQLSNVLVQAAVFTDGSEIQPGDLEDALCEIPGETRRHSAPILDDFDDTFDLQEKLEVVERLYLQKAMREAAGNKSKAARLLGLKSYQTLSAKLERLQLAAEDYSPQ